MALHSLYPWQGGRSDREPVRHLREEEAFSPSSSRALHHRRLLKRREGLGVNSSDRLRRIRLRHPPLYVCPASPDVLKGFSQQMNFHSYSLQTGNFSLYTNQVILSLLLMRKAPSAAHVRGADVWRRGHFIMWCRGYAPGPLRTKNLKHPVQWFFCCNLIKQARR